MEWKGNPCVCKVNETKRCVPKSNQNLNKIKMVGRNGGEGKNELCVVCVNAWWEGWEGGK